MRCRAWFTSSAFVVFEGIELLMGADKLGKEPVHLIGPFVKMSLRPLVVRLLLE